MDIVNKNIIAGCRRGDRIAQLELYKLLAPRMYRSCFYILGKPEDAEEAMQDAVMKVLKSLENSTVNVDYIEAWSRKIAIRTAIDYVRRHTEEMEEFKDYFLIDEEEQETADEDDIAFSVEKIKKACGELPAGYRIVLSLYLFEGYDMEEIGEILGIKSASVRSQYLRAKRKLIELLDK
jgi:RNA polymerase sigma-70 factor (ECF subfamily)